MRKPRTRRTIRCDWVYDLETEAWDKFVAGGLLNCATGEFSYSRNEREFAERVLACEGWLWAHNGGRFDTLWLAEWCRVLGATAEVYASSARVTLLKVGKLEVRDIVALVPLPLAQAAALGGQSKLSTGLACSCGVKCGGYCRIRRDMGAAEFAALVTYLEADCKVAAAILDALALFAADHDLDLNGTIGSSSWATARRRYELPEARWTTSDYNFAAGAKYGGRTQVFAPIAETAYCRDINSAYPDALARLELPVGVPVQLAGQAAYGALVDGKAGIYRAELYVPPMHVPPLPFRDDEGRIRYPIGDLHGTWTGHELVAALELGARVTSMGRALVWPTAERILGPFAEWGWGLRAQVGKASPFGKWMKWFLNSLTGKLGQNPDAELIYISPDAPARCPANGVCAGVLCGLSAIGCCPHRCTGRCKRSVPLGRPDSGIWSKPVWRIPGNGHVHWNAYLTAGARVKLGAELRSDGADGERGVYCDTDSIVSTHPTASPTTGPDILGGWLDEGRCLPWFDEEGYRNPGFEGFGPKMYRLNRHAPDGTHELVTRAKGITDADWESLRAHEPQTLDRGVKQFRTAARGASLFERKGMARTSRHDGLNFGDRILGDDGLTHPQKIPC